MTAASPIAGAEFTNLMSRLNVEPGQRMAVAVSGGPDSMSLARLVADWGPAQYLTVDHGLRPKSGKEAKRVHDWLADLGLDHHILKVDASAPESGIQEWARRQRYRLAERWCMDREIGVLALAHHQEDQAETFLLRLIRGSGVDGLAAMAPVSPPLTHPDGPVHIRPLLEVPKARLEATLRYLGQAWIEDPSNLDEAHTRVRVRKLMPLLADEGLTAMRLARTARRMRRAREALDHQSDTIISRHFEAAEEGYGHLDVKGLGGVPRELILRVVSHLLTTVSGAGYPPREEQLERLVDDLLAADFAGATLSGALVQPAGDGRVLVCREPAAVTDRQTIVPGDSVVWDGRYVIENQGRKDVEAGALGESGWRQLSGVSELSETANGLPAPARLTLPALRINGDIVAVPGLSFGDMASYPTEFLGFRRRLV